MRGDLLALDVEGLETELVVTDLLHGAAEDLEDLDHDIHVLDLRQVPEDDGLVGQESCGNAGQRRVLVSARLDPPLSGNPPSMTYCWLTMR